MYHKTLLRDNCSPTDFFNKKHKRNIKNTNFRCYNCGGYALNIFSWYIPRDKNNILRFNATTEKEMLSTTKIAVEFMLNEFKDLRVITDLKELQPNEYAIAFRIGGVKGENDFHFMKRGQNGRWYHKQGCLGIQSIGKEKVFADEWISTSWMGTCVYCGKLVLFAKKF